VSTWNALFDAALGEIGRADDGVGTASDRTLCLGFTNRLLGSWSTEIGPIHAETVDSLTWTSGNASRTIGTGGNFAVARPERLIKAHYRDSANLDSPLDIITHQGYQAIQNKTHTSGAPLALAYNPTIASGLGTLFIWPVPSSDVTIRLTSYKPFTAISDQTQDSGLPSGCEAAIVPNLALLIAPSFGVSPNPLTVREAQRSKGIILRANLIPQPMKSEWSGDGGDEINMWTNE
jgi:hypothetical protein